MLDNPNPKYLVPISPILFSIIVCLKLLNFYYDNKSRSRLFTLVKLDKPNPKYLLPISPILF